MIEAKKQEILAMVAAWLDAVPEDEPLPPGLDAGLAGGDSVPADLAGIVAGVTACSRELQIQGKSLKRLEAQLGAAAEQSAGEPGAREARLWLEVCDLHDRLVRGVAAGSAACDGAGWLARRLGGVALARSLLDGIALVAERAADLLSREGITPLPAAGLPFDPATMRALEAVKAPPGVAKDTVVECVRSGYVRGDSMLRPAEVRVAR